MRFFDYQDEARRKTRWLVLWYVLALCALVASMVLALILGANLH